VTEAVKAKPSDQNGDDKKIPCSKVYDLFVPEEWLRPGTFWKNIQANKIINFWGNK
jgi:aminopeptidase-like protein